MKKSKVTKLLLETAKGQLEADKKHPYDESWMRHPLGGADAINQARQAFWETKIAELEAR